MRFFPRIVFGAVSALSCLSMLCAQKATVSDRAARVQAAIAYAAQTFGLENDITVLTLGWSRAVHG